MTTVVPEEISSRLPFRFFKQNGASETLLDQTRATEGNMQVDAVPFCSFGHSLHSKWSSRAPPMSCPTDVMV